MVVCTKAQSHRDHGRAEYLHLAFLFVCMDDSCASLNGWMTNAVAKANLKYQSLSREQEEGVVYKELLTGSAGLDQKTCFLRTICQGVNYAKQSISKIHPDRLHTVLVSFRDTQLAADPGANPAHAGGITSPIWHWSISRSSRKSLERKLDVP